jgi:Mg2+/citrate symporter
MPPLVLFLCGVTCWSIGKYDRCPLFLIENLSLLLLQVAVFIGIWHVQMWQVLSGRG